MKNSWTYPILFMALVTAVFTLALATLNYSTAEKVEFLQDVDLKSKILYVFDIEIESDDPEYIDNLFDENIKEENIDGERIFIQEENGEIIGYALPTGGAGLWGSIDAYVGISADLQSILGLEFIEHSETPGLGGRISEEEYKGQFRDIDISSAEDGEYIIYRPLEGGNVDAITGATLTSESVRDFVNKDIFKFIEEREGNI